MLSVLGQIDDLEEAWLSLPEEQRLALPELAKLFESVKQ
jgi:hypothetical protein